MERKNLKVRYSDFQTKLTFNEWAEKYKVSTKFQETNEVNLDKLCTKYHKDENFVRPHLDEEVFPENGPFMIKLFNILKKNSNALR